MRKVFTVFFYLSTWLAWAQTSTVTLTSEKQYIRGFGGINHPEWAGDLTAAQRTTAFGNGAGQMGFTILRIFVNDDKTQWSKALATAKYVQSLGVTVFATPWNPPASMCETVTRNGRQEKRLKYDSYTAYAQHLIDFNNYMKTNGVNLYAMSFANEPDWGFDWTWYSSDEVYNFTKNLAGTLRVNGVKVITAESFSYNKNYYNQVLNDPAALSNIDIIGCHLYGSDANSPVSVYNYPLADQKVAGKERWMTEHYTNSDANSADIWPDANDVSYEIYRCMVEGQMSVYTWWYIRRQYGPMKEDGTVSKRGYCMAQYSKFIRPGYIRVDATKNPTTDVYVSAYKKGDDVVVVAVNRSTSSKTITISVPGTKVTAWEKYVTSGSKSLAKETNINAASGTFQITLDPQSTTSFVGTAPTCTTPTAAVTTTTPTIFCSGGNVVLTAGTGTGYTYVWKNGTVTITGATSSSYTASAAGNYTVTITNSTGCAATSAVTVVTVNSLPTATVSTTTPITFCSGGSVVLTSSIGTFYKWMKGTTQVGTGSTYTATTAGSYTVEVTNASGCKATSAATMVTVNALPTATITTTTPTTFCSGGSVVLTASAGSSYKWMNGTAQVGTAQTYTATTAGSYTVEVTNVNNCKATSVATVVTVNALPTAAITTTIATIFCSGGSVVLTASTGSSYKWMNGTAQVGTAQTYTATAAGSYTVEVTNANSCKATSTATVVTVNALPTAAITTTTAITFCSGGSVTLTASTGSSYKWMNGTSQVGTAQAYTATAAGSYTVEVTNANSCKATSAATVVTVNAAPNAPTVTSPETYCQNATATPLTATGTGLKWYADNTTTTALAAAPTPATTTAGTTNYYVSQTTNGCESSRAQIAVTVNALPTAAITTTTATTFCSGGSVVLTSSPGSSYKWMNGTAQVGTAQTYTATAAGSYTVEVTNVNSCKTTSAATAVTVNDLPLAMITASGSTTIPAGGSVVLTASSGSSYRWFKGTTQVGIAASFTATEAGVYTVEVTNASGCSSTSAGTAVNMNTNKPSQITITSPSSNSSVQGAITITADITDPDGSIVLVEYLDGNNVIGTSKSAPYSLDWNDPSAGSHVITIRVTDSNGGITVSAPVTVTSEPVTTGVQSSNTLNANVYPNPASGIVFIESDTDLSGADFMLIDVMGNEHSITQTANGLGAQINLSDLSDGSYILIIKKDNSIMRKKIALIK